MKRLSLLLILLSAFLSAQEPAPPAAPPPPTGPQPEAVVSQETYDAGNVLKGKKIEYTFKIKNAGKAELSILSAKAG